MDELSAIPQASREIALQRLQLLRPHLEEARPLRTVASEASIPYRTALRWANGYRKDGLAALARRSRSDQGGRRLASTTLVKAIEGLALERPPLPMSSIHRQASAIAETLKESKPSYAVVRRIVQTLPAGLVMLAHRGNRVYSEGFDLVHRREAFRPNSIWQVDHAQLDIKLLRDDGSVGKPWLTIVIDDYSRAVAGYYLGFEPPSSLRTTLALRQGIWRKGDPHWEICGIPDHLYTDNGSDFRSKHLEQVAADLKIQLVFSTPGQPQGRGRIERFFRTVNEMFLCDLDGYTTRSGRKPTLTLDSFEKQFHTFLLEVYHRRPSSEGNPSPKERWEQGGFLPRMPDSIERLDLLLIHEVRTRKVRTDGIHFHNFRYLSLTLAAYVGEDVTIRFDPRDMGEIRVFYRDRFLCRAISADLAGQTVPLRDIVNARKRRREQLRTIVRDRLKTVDTLLEFRRGMQREDVHASMVTPVESKRSKLKRYFNE
ncbi:putative transposase [Edaphobacter aggregans]|uniref:Putative transposase n=1 Tax=Edaphobacter aggregans TaxID=570835 RepID=A0A3R9PVD1_9BACT|nr:Mu transposase C-terminal domain-containing protein [Edaphobacter aggregans]RSL18705.1 putative transposase [Edaphobacter aggregans]